MAPPKHILMNAFFDQLFEFVKELKAMYPDDPDFPLFETTLRLLKSTTPGFAIKHFYDTSKGFEEQILSKNEDFFMDHSFSELGDELDFDILGKLKQYVKGMSSNSKEAVWGYVQNLFKLVKAYHS